MNLENQFIFMLQKVSAMQIYYFDFINFWKTYFDGEVKFYE